MLQPTLHRRRSPLTAAVMVSVVWAGWHLPLFGITATYRTMPAAGFLGFYLHLLVASLVLAWLYLRSSGSLLVLAVGEPLRPGRRRDARRRRPAPVQPGGDPPSFINQRSAPTRASSSNSDGSSTAKLGFIGVKAPLTRRHRAASAPLWNPGAPRSGPAPGQKWEG